MIPLPERQKIVVWIHEAVQAGARKHRACEEAGISVRTLQRWTQAGEVKADGRPEADRPEPRNKLAKAEREQIVEICNREDYASLPPSQIVPRLADAGQYLASESSFYRTLKEVDQLHERGRARRRMKPKPLATHVALAANQVWSWDITYLPAPVRGRFYYLYLVEDIYSRKIVSWEVYEKECGEYAAVVIERGVFREKCLKTPLVLHSDNGSPMKSYTLMAKLEDLGVSPSYSRPRVSNDNAFSESLFRTLKYCPQWPSQGFGTLDDARTWVQRFVQWYNQEHRHSQIRFVTPAQRHVGEDVEILAQRQKVYEKARQKNPARWSGKTRNWEPVAEVTLNPVKNEEIEQAVA